MPGTRYAGLEDADKVVVFSIDEAGKLAGHVPTKPAPSAFCLDSKGKFLAVAGNASSRLASDRIDDVRATLTPLEVRNVGLRPAAIGAASFGRASH